MPLIPSLLGDLGMYCLEEATIGGLVTSIREQAPEVSVAVVRLGLFPSSYIH